MSEQPNPAPANTLATVLDKALYLDIAQAALGDVEIMPADVKQALQEVTRPDDATWTGSSAWLTAYHAGLREHVLSKRAAAGRASTAADAEARNKHKMRVISRLHVANSVAAAPPETLPSAAWADPEGPRADFQRRYGSVLRWAAVSPPARSERLPNGERPIMDDTIVVPAPTGVGKTLLGGNYLAAAGIGQETPAGKRKRALWITVSQQLIADVLNEDKTMQKTLPEGVTTTAIWQDNKEESSASGDLVAITLQSLEDALTAIEEGRPALIDPQDFDILMFDEAHEGLSPRMTRLLQRFDCQKVLLTATPARSNYISLLNRYHHVPSMGRREAIEEGLLSPVHIVSIMAENMQHAEHQAALAAIDFFIKHGKKATIYCQPGDENGQARRVAALIGIYAEQMLGDNYNPALLYAEMVGSANINSKESIAAFEKQTHGGVRTTTQMFGVGWDPVELDGSIWIGPQGDLLALIQESGRSGRPKADGRAAWWIQIHTPIPEGSRGGNYVLPQTVGLEEIPPADWEIGPRHTPPIETPLPADYDGPERADAPRGPGQRAAGEGSNGTEAGTQARSSPTAEEILAGVSDELKRSFVKPHTPLAEIVIESSRRQRYIAPPEYSITDEELASRHNVPVSFIHYFFEPSEGLPDVSYKTLRTLRIPGVADDARVYIRHYHAEEVAARLAVRPIPRVSDTIYSMRAMAQALHAPENAIDGAIKALGLPLRPATRAPQGYRSGPAAPRYTLAEYASISEYIERTPLAGPQDQPWSAVVEQYPLGAKMLDLELDREPLRHPPTSDRKGTEYFVQAEKIIQVAEEDARRRTLVPAKEAAERVGVSLNALQAGMNEEQRAFFDEPRNRFSPIGGTKNSRHLTTEMVDELAERIGPKPLRYNEVTIEMVRARLAEEPPDMSLRNLLKPYGNDGSEPRRLMRLQRLPVRVFDVRALRAAEEKYGRNPDQPEINYGWFEREASDPSDELVAYARDVQTTLLGADWLQLAPDLPRELRLERERLRAQADAAQAAEPIPDEPPTSAPAADLAPAPAPESKPEPELEPEVETAPPTPEPPPSESVAPEPPTSEPAAATDADTPQEAAEPVQADELVSMTPIRDVARQSNTRTTAVTRTIRNLGFAERVHDGRVPTWLAEQLVKALGGRKPGKPDLSTVLVALPPAGTGTSPDPLAKPAAESEAVPTERGSGATEPAAAPPAEMMHIDEIIAQSGRTAGAVSNVIRQLNLGNAVQDGQLPRASGEAILKMLGGGKRAPVEEPAPSVLDVGHVGTAPLGGSPGADLFTSAHPATSEVLSPGRERDENGTIWRDLDGAHGILEDLRSTRAAFSFLSTGAPKELRARTNQEGVHQVSEQLVNLVKMEIKRLRLFDTSGWMTHEVLARNMELNPEELVGYMREQGIQFGAGDLRVRRNPQRRGLLELMYSEKAWQRVMRTRPKPPRNKN